MEEKKKKIPSPVRTKKPATACQQVAPDRQSGAPWLGKAGWASLGGAKHSPGSKTGTASCEGIDPRPSVGAGLRLRCSAVFRSHEGHTSKNPSNSAEQQLLMTFPRFGHTGLI